ncbi:unnamed protein product [Withania somnifera]
MANQTSVDVILEFLRKNKFTRAEAALRGELNNHPDLNGVLQKLTIEDKELRQSIEGGSRGKATIETPGTSFRNSEDVYKETSSKSSGEISKELIIKEIECGTGRNGSDCNWKNVQEQKKVGESVGTSDKSFSFPNSSEDAIDMYSWKYTPGNGPVTYQHDSGATGTIDLSSLVHSGKLKFNSSEVFDSGKAHVKCEEDVSFSGEKRTSWPGSTSKDAAEPKHDSGRNIELKKVDQQIKLSGTCSKDVVINNPWSKSDEFTQPSSEPWRDCTVKTFFPFSKGDVSTSYDHDIGSTDGKEGKRKTAVSDVRAAIKEQVDEVGRALYLGKTQGSEPKEFSGLGFSFASENQKEGFPRLPPVRLKSEEKFFSIPWEEKFERDGPASKITNADNSFFIGSFLDVPIGQDLTSSGGKRPAGGSWLSVSQGIAEDTSDLVSGFATIGDGLSESIDYPNEYWDSDEYDDDDDVGYTRQPIEDETWFLAHEIDYPSDNEKGTGHGSVPDPQRGENREDNEHSFAEEDSCFPVSEMYRRTDESELIAQYDGQLMDEEELNLMRTEPVWRGFVTQTNELVMLGDGKVLNECGRSRLDDICMDDDQHGSVRSIGVGINSDTADFGSEVRESLVGGSSEGDIEYFHDHDASIGGSRHPPPIPEKPYIERSKREKKAAKHSSDEFVTGTDKGNGELVQTSSSKSLWSNKCNTVISDEADDSLMANDDMLAPWRRKRSESSPPVKSSRDESNANAAGSENSSPASLSNYGYAEREHVKKKEQKKIASAREEDVGASLEDEEATAVQEQVRQIKAQEEEFETFELKIVHRKNRTGFEEDKNFHVVLNSVIAGRYQVTEYLGSAAFSKAIQAHDLHTGMDVCVKIIKNNKDFFDQSLDEIKLLKYVNKHDPADKYHLLRLYDYFYYREHLLIVCELLKANLYEFHKFNRESGGEVYFTMPRLQSITIQCLEALQFLHGLGLIHCDLKPENILVKSYSRCEVKVIDLGSSCFETDHLCSYVQSRSYRAPEVILGLPYDKKIDIWSLGCILAELCTGNVLFQNDSPATLLARVIGIIGQIDQDLLVKGRDTYKYFTKNHMLYERNQETNRLEYLIPKKTSLRHRLPMGDQGFIDFVAHLLEVNPKKRPSASEALKHPWLSYPYEPISS